MDLVTPDFRQRLQTAEGCLELGLSNDAVEALEDIEPELKTRPEVIAARVGICDFKNAGKKWR